VPAAIQRALRAENGKRKLQGAPLGCTLMALMVTTNEDEELQHGAYQRLDAAAN